MFIGKFGLTKHSTLWSDSITALLAISTPCLPSEVVPVSVTDESIPLAKHQVCDEH